MLVRDGGGSVRIGLRAFLLGAALTIECREVNRIQQERRKSAIACRLGDNSTGEGKHDPGTFDHAG